MCVRFASRLNPALSPFRSDSASKAGLHHLSRVFANHLAPRGITSNTIACGAFESKSASLPLAHMCEAEAPAQ